MDLKKLTSLSKSQMQRIIGGSGGGTCGLFTDCSHGIHAKANFVNVLNTQPSLPACVEVAPFVFNVIRLKPEIENIVI